MFKLAKIKTTQLNKVSDDLQKQYAELKSDTLDFDADFHIDEIAENDELLYKLIQQELDAKSDTTPTPKEAKIKVPKPTAVITPKTDFESKYKVGQKFYYKKSGNTITVLEIEKSGNSAKYKLSSSKNWLTQSKVDTNLETKWTKSPPAKKTTNKATPPKEMEQTAKLNWRQKLPESFLQDAEEVILATTFKAVKAKEKTPLALKNTASIGDIILINEDDHLHTVLTKTMADRFMRKGAFENTYVRKETYDKCKKELEQLKGTLAEKEVVSVPEPAKVETPEPPKAAKEKPKKEKKSKCSIDTVEYADVVAKVIKFLEANSIRFHQIYKSKEWLQNEKEIKAIYTTTGDEPSRIIVRVANHRKGFAFAKAEYYTLCLEKWELTPMERKDVPIPQRLRKVITDQQLKAIYSTKGADKFSNCMVLYKELYKCQKDGNCTAADKKKYQHIYENCGNLARKFPILKEQMEVLYEEARIIKETEDMEWSTALGTAARRLRE